MRLQWPNIPEASRVKIETKLQCCGYDDTDDGVEGCKFKKSCNEYVPGQYKKRTGTGIGAIAAALIAGAINLFGAFCLNRKMRKQEGRARKKAFTSLQDEARGINKNTRKQRPPRSERTPNRADANV